MAADDQISPTPLPSDAGGGGAGSWISQHKGAAAGIGIAGLVGLYLFLKNRSSSSSGSGGSVGTSTGPAVYEIAPGYLQSGGGLSYGAGQGYGQTIAGNTVTGTTGGGPSGLTPTSGAALKSEALVGGGYGPPAGSTTVIDSAGKQYTWLSTGAQGLAAQQAGIPLEYQPAPGQFSPVPQGSLTGTGGWFVGGQPTPVFVGG